MDDENIFIPIQFTDDDDSVDESVVTQKKTRRKKSRRGKKVLEEDKKVLEPQIDGTKFERMKLQYKLNRKLRGRRSNDAVLVLLAPFVTTFTTPSTSSGTESESESEELSASEVVTMYYSNENLTAYELPFNMRLSSQSLQDLRYKLGDTPNTTNHKIITELLVDVALTSNVYHELVQDYKSRNDTLSEKVIMSNIKHWQNMCQAFCTDHGIIFGQAYDERYEEFYKEQLSNHVVQEVINAIKIFDATQSFAKFDEPMVICGFQSNNSEFLPRMDILLSYEKLVKLRLVPPKPSKGLIYILFWSFGIDFNLFGNITRTDDNLLKYQLVGYNRITDDVEQLVIHD